MKLTVILFIAVSITACTDLSALLIHPDTKEVKACKISGYGITGTIVANSRFNSCVEDAKAKGFTQVQKAGDK
jgi:hypothetical protein